MSGTAGPRLGLGAVKLGSATGSRGWAHDVRLVREAVDLGVTLIDTSNLYAQGLSERIVGKAIRGRRDAVTLATKGGYLTRPRTRAELTARRMVVRARSGRGRGGGAAAMSPGPSPSIAQDFGPGALRIAVEGSLRRLGVEHIDVYQFHGPPAVHAELPGELADLVRDGKVGRFGVGAEDVRSALAWSAVPNLSVVQLPFGILDAEAADIVPTISAHGCEVWARGVFGGGVFARSDVSGSRVGQDERLAALDELAARHGTDRYRLGFEFVRTTPHVDAIVIGVATRSTLHRTVALAAAPGLDAELRNELHRLVRTHPVAERGSG